MLGDDIDVTAADAYSEAWWERRIAVHPATKDCPDMECDVCSWRDCPYREPMHYHHDGCPCCAFSEDDDARE